MTTTTTFQLKELDLRKIQKDEVIIIVGKRSTGKSFLTRDILYHHREIPVGDVICSGEDYKDIVPPTSIHTEYTPRITRKIVKRQREATEQVVQENGSLMSRRAFLVMDNCFYDMEWKKDRYLREIFMNNRSQGLFFILTIPYAIGIPPNLRANADWIFLFRETYIGNIRKLYESYACMFPTFDLFCQMIDACTEDHGCLVIHNSAPSNRLEDQVYWYKAKAHGDFQMGWFGA